MSSWGISKYRLQGDEGLSPGRRWKGREAKRDHPDEGMPRRQSGNQGGGYFGPIPQPARKPSWIAPLPFLPALDGKRDATSPVQGRSDVEQLELPWLPESPQGGEEAVGRGGGQHFLHIMAAHQELGLVWQPGTWGGQVSTQLDPTLCSARFSRCFLNLLGVFPYCPHHLCSNSLCTTQALSSLSQHCGQRLPNALQPAGSSATQVRTDLPPELLP